MKIYTYDGQTNTANEVELDADQATSLSLEIAKLSDEREARVAKNEADKIAKNAIYERLGLTADEVKLLLS